MRILLIQVVLVVGILIISARLLRGRGARVVALRRIGMLAFAALAIASILFPETWTRVAKLVGVPATSAIKWRKPPPSGPPWPAGWRWPSRSHPVPGSRAGG